MGPGREVNYWPRVSPHAETINEQFRNHLVRNGTRGMQTRTTAAPLLLRRMLHAEEMKTREEKKKGESRRMRMERK